MSYRITGCEGDDSKYNGTYTFIKEYEGSGVRIYKNGSGCQLRFTPGGYGWDFGWYTNMNKPEEHPPSTGWKFNGGRCIPADLGSKIAVTPV